MLNGSILDKLTKRFETLQQSSSVPAANKPYSKQIDSEEEKSNRKNTKDTFPSRNKVKQEARQPEVDDESSQESSPYVIRPKLRRFAGNFAANNKTFDNLYSPHIEAKLGPKLKADDPATKLMKQQGKLEKSITKKEGNNSIRQDSNGGIFNQKFKRNFVLSMLQKVQNEKQEDKLNILRRQAREVGVGFFDAKIWVIGYKLVFQIEDQLRNQDKQITQQIIKNKIATKVKLFWQKNTHQKRYYLLKLQSVMFKAFDIYENNPGVWFDNNITQVPGYGYKRQNQALTSYDIYGKSTIPNPPPGRQNTAQMPYFSSRHGNNGVSQTFISNNDKKYNKPINFISDKKQIVNKSSRAFQPITKRNIAAQKRENKKNNMQQPINISYKIPSKGINNQGLPIDFRAKVAEKLDQVFKDFINKTLDEKAGQFCMNKDALRQIYDNFGSLNLQNKKSLSCDRHQLQRSIQQSGLYSKEQISKIIQNFEISEPNQMQKLLLKQDLKRRQLNSSNQQFENLQQ